MKSELDQIIESIPKAVSWKEIVDFDNFDERLSAICVLFVNTIGVCENYIEFCPDNEPPLREEELSWIWPFRPDLSDELLKLELSNDFRMLINSYKESEMDKFWDYIS
ncbi:hypothetical protein [uncultured Marixanthomonas sp.]|uniref:hypothetical protein n=1 Tax=uncultured Marixanthomonas sp. TaxID=757245 RepID=UPI0030DBE230|tara:strand:- start:78154 stop:78477 length:324 start_codon:yes stop_codon:yes gene_type:complete